MKRQRGAIAVDLGASSARYAAGWIEDGRVRFEIVEQRSHKPIVHDGREVWDAGALVRLCEEASAYGAASFETCTIGIDSWGVDFGFIDDPGRPVPPVVCYRDTLHKTVFDEMRPHRAELFQLTGIQHQPFNTFYQLVARKQHGDDVGREWLFLPSWMSQSLGANCDNDLTMASTSQLLRADGTGWCERAFEIAGLKMPNKSPRLPGEEVGKTRDGVEIVQVAGHDTACAVHGIGRLSDAQAFLSLGTWSLLGCIIDEAILTAEAEVGGFSNERAVDGRVRFLTNVAGFYVVNRLHEELNIARSVSDWIATASLDVEAIDLRDQEFFNPSSMAAAVIASLGREPRSESEWAGVAIKSLIRTNADQLARLEEIAARSFGEIRVSGGPSRSELFCRLLAQETGKRIVAGPQEATILGNLAQQLGADDELIMRSIDAVTYVADD